RMSRAQTMLHVTLPRAIRIGLPPYSNEVILMLKSSALASTITLVELTGAARTDIARTYLPVEFFFAAGVIYLIIAFVLVQGFKLLERWRRVDACQGRCPLPSPSPEGLASPESSCSPAPTFLPASRRS